MRRLAPLLVVPVLLALSLAPARAAEEEPDYETTEGISKPVYTQFVDEEYRVPTKHGTIYGVVRRPVVGDAVKVPVILTYSPYNILDRPLAAMVTQTDEVTTFFTPRGYARASFDLVGTRESSGCYDAGGIRERETAKAVVDFLGTRSWSSGKVGMIGASYDGTTQWAAAIEQPEHLTTIVPQVAIGRWYDYAYGNGVRFASGSGTPYLFDFGFGFLPPTGVTGGTAWAEAVRDHATPCERVEHNQEAFLPDPVYDGYWDERDYLAKIARVRPSVLVVGSWADYNVHPVNSYEMWRALPDSHPKKLIMGQAGHSDTQVKDTKNLYHAWFDHWLLGLDTGIMDLPRSDSITQDKRRFQDSAWPPVATVDVPLSLVRGTADKGTLSTAVGEVVRWTDDNPGLSEDDVISGSAAAVGRGVLFVGAPVDTEVRVSGVPRLHLEVTTDEASTFLTPVLFVQDPSGKRRVVTRGLLNSRNRDGLRTSTDLVPGTPWQAVVEFQPVDAVVSEGGLLGVALMSMNTEEALYPDDTQATNTIELRASRLVVPVSLGAAALGTAVLAPPPGVVAPQPVVVPIAAPKPALPATGTDLPAIGLLALALVMGGVVVRRHALLRG